MTFTQIPKQYYANDTLKEAVVKIIEGYEKIWKDNSVWGDWEERCKSTKKIYANKKQHTHATPAKGIVWINAPASPPKKVDANRPLVISPSAPFVIGDDSFTHDIVASIIFEMGNCVNYVPKNTHELIEASFYSGNISLKACGEKTALIEATATKKYVELMRVIPATNRPYQSNRDVYLNRANFTQEQFGETFCDSLHNPTDKINPDLTSGDRYSLDAICSKKVTRENIIKATRNVVCKMFDSSCARDGGPWDKIVQIVAKKFPLESKHNAGVYLAGLELLYKVFRSERRKWIYNLMSFTDNWFTPPMIKGASPIGTCTLTGNDSQQVRANLTLMIKELSWRHIGPPTDDSPDKVSGKYIKLGN
jgi:hypothetical protein